MRSQTTITEEVLVALRRIIRVIDLHSKKLVQKYGLTGPQMLILKEILHFQSITISRLAKNVNLSHATVTSILDRLENKGYIQRERDQVDKRKIFAKPTSTTVELFKEGPNTPNLLQEDFVQEFSKLEHWEQTQILSTLQRIASMMGGKTIEAASILATGYSIDE